MVRLWLSQAKGGHAVTAGDEEARLRAQEHHAEFAIRREELAMKQQERRLAHELQTLAADEERAEVEIEAEIRVEHWGHEPERPLTWKDRPDNGS
jgi:hypothetical protein